MNPGIAFSNPQTVETGWMMPVGYYPEIQSKLTTPDLDAQAAMAEPWEGGKRGHIGVKGIPIGIENPAHPARPIRAEGSLGDTESRIEAMRVLQASWPPPRRSWGTKRIQP